LQGLPSVVFYCTRLRVSPSYIPILFYLLISTFIVISIYKRLVVHYNVTVVFYRTRLRLYLFTKNSSEVDSSKLFDQYVTHFYDKKKKAKDTIERNIAKLMLNSLYGKFGQKDIENRIRMVSREEANKLVKSHHVSYFAEINEEKILIKYSSK
jgi:DNA polymerase type B, organellar and viral